MNPSYPYAALYDLLPARRLSRIQQTFGVSDKICHFVRALHDHHVGAGVIRPQPEALRETGQKNDRVLEFFFSQPGNELEPIDRRHTIVRNHQIEDYFLRSI